MLSYLYSFFYEDEIKPDPKTIRQRNLLMKQIKFSKLKLKSSIPIAQPVKISYLDALLK